MKKETENNKNPYPMENMGRGVIDLFGSDGFALMCFAVFVILIALIALFHP